MPHVKPGQTVWLTAADGTMTKGKVQAVGTTGVLLTGRTSVPLSSITRIETRDSLKNGAIIGAIPTAVLFGLGAAALSGFCLNQTACEDSAASTNALLGAVAGAGMGPWSAPLSTARSPVAACCIALQGAPRGSRSRLRHPPGVQGSACRSPGSGQFHFHGHLGPLETRRVQRPSRTECGPMQCLHASMIALAFGVAWASPADASESSRAMTQDAYALAYELRFADSLGMLEKAHAADLGDPAPLRAIAAITWIEILFGQGVTTFAAFDGEATDDAVARPAVPPHLSERFVRHVKQALRLADIQRQARPDDADAQYQAAASGGLLALYLATVEGRTWAAFNEGRDAVSTMERLRRRNAQHREAALIPGIYRYSVSTLPWAKRILAAAWGMAGDRAGGILMLETAAADGTETATDASLVLMIVYNREKRHADAMRHLHRLHRSILRTGCCD